jgi:diguanylate cyclase (GGDEF)-like protein
MSTFRWDDDDEFEAPEEATKVADRAALSALEVDERAQAYLILLAGPNVGEMHRIEGVVTIGRSPDATIRIVDDEISRVHARLVNDRGRVSVRDLQSTNGTFVNGEKVTERLLEDGDKLQFGTTTILKFTYHDRLEENFQRQLYQSALHDSLTGAYNRRHFDERLESEFAYLRRHEGKLTLVMFDLDRFKEVNDTYGHLAGDYVLRRIGTLVKVACRTEDLFARYGGEEFGLVLRGVEAQGGCVFAERLRALIESTPFEHEGQVLRVTASFGLASIPHPQLEAPEQLIAAADGMLYQAKHNGRNRVEVFEEA